MYRKLIVIFTIISFILIMSPSLIFAQGVQGYINSDNVNLRTSPYGDVIDVLMYGEKVGFVITKKGGDGYWWAEVGVIRTGQHGWIRADFIAEGNP